MAHLRDVGQQRFGWIGSFVQSIRCNYNPERYALRSAVVRFIEEIPFDPELSQGPPWALKLFVAEIDGRFGLAAFQESSTSGDDGPFLFRMIHRFMPCNVVCDVCNVFDAPSDYVPADVVCVRRMLIDATFTPPPGPARDNTSSIIPTFKMRAVGGRISEDVNSVTV